MTGPEILDLCSAVRRRDAVAEEQLVALLRVQVGRYCSRFGDYSEDAFQRVVTLVIDHIRLGRLEHPERVVYYALSIARRQRLRALRHSILEDNMVSIDDPQARLSKRLARFLEVPAAAEANLLNEEAEREQALTFWRAFRELDPLDQRIIRRFYFQRQTPERIELELRLTRRQFSNRKSRALLKLRKSVYVTMPSTRRVKPKPGGELAVAA